MVYDELAPRQTWARPTETTPLVAARTLSNVTVTSQALSALCTVALPSGGTLRFNETYSLVLDESIPFESSCDDHAIHGCANNGNSTVVKFDPFYASVAPQIYALATATVISYILVILIFITPRTFFVGGPGGGHNLLGLRSLVPGSVSSSVIGIGRRPLLQKIAAITVAISLTIATADTFNVAEQQYNEGLINSQGLVDKVIGSTEIRVVRVISDTFLWLAQVQTLIRLFPRHKEKVTIKWLGFGLVTCDTVFSILENFVSETYLTRPRKFEDAIPALSYLFQMSISLIYASCVIYYSLSKRRFAFWHPKMKNILLVAALSLTSVLIPVVFFVLDVSQPNIATWGEYIRWVGAAAASVVVWEWVERIEALERDEKKDGILGREIFDGDEMLDMGSDNHSTGASTYFGFGKRTHPDHDEKSVSILPISGVRSRMPFRKSKATNSAIQQTKDRQKNHHFDGGTANGIVTRPPQVATPISRSDTTSAASTVYAVRYQNVSSPSPAIPEEPPEAGNRSARTSAQNDRPPVVPEELESSTAANKATQEGSHTSSESEDGHTEPVLGRNRQVWQAVANPFKRKRTEPPAEVAAQMAASNARRSPAQTYHNLRDRLNAFRKGERGAGKERTGPSPPMPVTVIPAQPRRSRLTVPGEISRESRHSSITSSQRDRKSSSSRSHREQLPITVIPAPTKGGRTWSPEDLKTNGGIISRQASNEVTSRDSVQEPSRQGGEIAITRGALTIAEPLLQAREHGNRNSPASNPSGIRMRAPTIDSLNDRLSAHSPGSAATASTGVGSQSRQSQSPVTNSHPPSSTPRGDGGNRDSPGLDTSLHDR